MLPEHLSTVKRVTQSRPDVNFLATKFKFIKDGETRDSPLSTLPEGFYGLDLLLRLARERIEESPVRLRAIRALGSFDDPRSSAALTEILLDKSLSHDEHLAAVEGLSVHPDNALRPTVIQVMDTTWNEDVLLALIGLLAEIGTPDDVPLLERVGKRGSVVQQYAADAIEDITSE